MFQRDLQLPGESFFLFGPRGTGKSTLLRERCAEALVFDLLNAATYGELLLHPERLATRIAAARPSSVVIDEIQRLPGLLNEVHRLIESSPQSPLRFVLTGSSARKLRRGGANLLAGRARTRHLHPLTAAELGKDFDLRHSLRFGQLPTAYTASDPREYLASYVGTYLREEVQAEAATRNLEAFSRFVLAASFSQAAVLSIAEFSRDLGIARKTVEGYFQLLEDLLLSVRLPVFTRRAKRALTQHPKFYYFDVGVFRALRPRGPLDSEEEIDGAAVETLVLQELRATNDNLQLGFELFFWRTRDQKEIDFVLYGERGLMAIEVKRAHTYRESDLEALRAFKDDYPLARCFLFYSGDQRYEVDGIGVVPLAEALPALGALLVEGAR
jgi:uncharacterized protein